MYRRPGGVTSRSPGLTAGEVVDGLGADTGVVANVRAGQRRLVRVGHVDQRRRPGDRVVLHYDAVANQGHGEQRGLGTGLYTSTSGPVGPWLDRGVTTATPSRSPIARRLRVPCSARGSIPSWRSWRCPSRP